MGIRSLKTASISTGVKRSKVWDQSATTVVPNSYESISTVTVGSGGTGTVTFSSIPSTYKHLQLRVFAQTDRGTYGIDEAHMRFNSDTGSNYAAHRTFGNGATTSSSAETTQTGFLVGSGCLGTTTGGQFGINIIDILDYASTNKYKTTRTLSGTDHNGAQYGSIGGRVGLNSSLWMNSANAISTITLTPANSSNFTQYSSFALYGIKGA
jgi:hypothetical protein